MNGAESLVRTLLAGNVDVCFTNPGTSEMHFVAALDRAPEMRCILGLFEGVVTGAADGYARMVRRPASTLLHLGPGLANGLANLHNARRARVSIVNIVGEHATYHRALDAPLTSDIEAVARAHSAWVRTTQSAAEVGADAADAIAAARADQGGIATLILPADAAWDEGGKIGSAPPAPPQAPLDLNAVERAAAVLHSGQPAALVLAGGAAIGRGLDLAGRIAAATGAALLTPFSFTRLERGAGRPIVERIPYVVKEAVSLLAGYAHLILVGAPAPVAFFGYPGQRSALTPDGCEIQTLTHPTEDPVPVLEALADALGTDTVRPVVQQAERPGLPTGSITLPGLAAVIGALLPEQAIVIDESITSGRGIMAATRGAPPHDYLVNTGGSIGIAMPLAVGAAVACPERPVLCLSADGSGMYTLQALWTMAREALRITTVVFANRAYAILKGEFLSVGGGSPGPRASAMLEIGRPDLDWVSLSKGMGVPALRVTTLDAFADALRAGLETGAPNLIEVVI